MADKDPQAETGAPSHAAYLLRRIAEEAQHAQELDDPLKQAKIVATLIQPYAGWALRETVLDCRDAGRKWSQIAPEVGLSQAVLARQARGSGPVVTIAPSYGDADRNPDGQTPLRLAATTVAHRTMALAMTHPDTPAAQRLYIAVMAMAQAQATDQPEPLLRTVQEVLRTAGQVDQTPHHLAAATTGAERSLGEALAELRTAYERDHGTIRVAAELNAPQKAGKNGSDR